MKQSDKGFGVTLNFESLKFKAINDVFNIDVCYGVWGKIVMVQESLNFL